MKPTRPQNSLFLIGLALTLNFGCSTKRIKPEIHYFNELARNPEAVFSIPMTPKVIAALKAYREDPDYGKSVRNLNLKNKSLKQIDQSMLALHCPRHTDLLKDPKTKKPLLDSKNQTIPMWVYLCKDGGVVRIKPQGDPTSKFRPQASSSKSLRYPADSAFENFDDEIVKVDNAGYPIPKWGKELKILSQDPNEQKEWIETWANDAHTDLPL